MIDDLPLGEEAWISFIVRDGHLVPAQAQTRLRPGDEIVVLSGDEDEADLADLFTRQPVTAGRPSQADS